MRQRISDRIFAKAKILELAKETKKSLNYLMAKRCLTFDVKYAPSSKIGSGFWSHVYSIEAQPNLVMKLVKFADDDDYEEGYQAEQEIESFEREISIQRIASDKGLAPRIIDHWICNNDWGVVVMERLEKTVEQYTRSKPARDDIILIIKTLPKAIDLLHSAGIFHQDIKLDNLALSTKENELPMDLAVGRRYLYFIDFGSAKTLDDSRVYITEDESCRESISSRRKSRDDLLGYIAIKELVELL